MHFPYTILPLYQELIAMTATGIAHRIANALTLFNVFNTIIFLPFVKPFAALIPQAPAARPIRSSKGPIS